VTQICITHSPSEGCQQKNLHAHNAAMLAASMHTLAEAAARTTSTSTLTTQLTT
jgi:hypothetical protein